MQDFDAIVVGAGPSGNAAAYTLAKSGLKVLQIERGEYPGSKNVQGAILYADALERIKTAHKLAYQKYVVKDIEGKRTVSVVSQSTPRRKPALA